MSHWLEKLTNFLTKVMETLIGWEVRSHPFTLLALKSLVGGG